MTPLNSDSVGVGASGLPLLGSAGARSTVTRTELVNGDTAVDLVVIIVSGWCMYCT